MKKGFRSKTIIVSAALLLSAAAFAQIKQAATRDSLYAGFTNPDNAARPRVWWHWMNGNITKDGIRKDLEWMHRSGIGGFQNFDAALMTPQVVQKRLVYMTPEWKDAFQFTTRLADSLKLEMAIAGSPGWSESGGPWVKPADGMKKLVWTETRVQGSASNIHLPQPPSVTGPFQNIPKQAELGFGGGQEQQPTLYKNVSVIAYKLPDADKTMSELGAVITSSGGDFNLAQLTDGDLATTNLLPSDTVKGFAWIQFAFPQPQAIKSITIVGGGDRGPFGLYGELKETRSLEVSDDGQNFKWACYIPAGNVLEQTIAIPAITAKYFRVTFKNLPAVDVAAMMGITGMPKPKAPAGTDIAELVLSPVTRVHMFEEKAAFAPATGLYEKATPASDDGIAPNDVIDVTDKLNADGTLNWNVPAGNWKILRFGYSLLGITNHPATPEATGLEVDKLDPTAVKNYFTNYLNQYKDATGGLMGARGLQYMITDSWEAGAQNWTPNLIQEFQKRRSYSMIPWMPVLAGQVVKSTQASDDFLWDFRKTLSEMLAEYHYDQLTSILATYGMKRYSESHEDRRALIADGMDVKRKAAVPMSAMWMPSAMNGGDRTVYMADIRESASVAHIYGQNLVAAESLTASGAAFTYAPENLKSTADLELASGLNRFVIHTSVHQPLDKMPGFSLGPVGQWFTRLETWAEQAKVWTDYLARSSYMLQQGEFVADVVYYYGEDNNITGLFGKRLPDVPEGYNYDFINADALVNLLSVKEGRLVTPSGMSYQVLVLDSNARYMSLVVLRKIAQLVKAGATISGIKPEMDASLKDDQQEFQRLVNEVWGANNAKVITGKALSEVLPALNIQPDFTYTRPQENTKLLYVHRKLANGDLYWVNSRNDSARQLEATFRLTGKMPQLWHPETGKTEDVSYTIADGMTKVTLPLQPNDAVFVVFKEPATKTSVTLPLTTEKDIVTVEGPWKVTFQPNRGAPATATFNQLQSYTENSDAGIKYFSGTATYTKSINVPANALSKGSQLWLNLGDVKNLAEVTVNGKPLGVIWKKPFRVDVSNALKADANNIQIKVTNLWVNRLIGDAQPGVTDKITFTTWKFYQANATLLPSGLLGPVKIVSIGQ
jgi:hypothetical protein